MTKKFRNKYRIESTRLQNWHYGWDACYFITICTANRECFFGDIKNGTMVLSEMGLVANDCWYEIKNHAHHIDLGDFVIMPNHIHGILILNENNNGFGFVDTRREVISVDPRREVISIDPRREVISVDPRHALDQQINQINQNQPTIGQLRFQNQGKNTISSIVGSYKSAVTKLIHRMEKDFSWQSGFYDHIIRNENSYQRITEYIKRNPAKWNDDKLSLV